MNKIKRSTHLLHWRGEWSPAHTRYNFHRIFRLFCSPLNLPSSQIASAQKQRDDKVKELVLIMAESCSFADEADILKTYWKKDEEIIDQLLRQLMECAYFIRDYCKDEYLGT
jgi:hypothetical protein